MLHTARPFYMLMLIALLLVSQQSGLIMAANMQLLSPLTQIELSHPEQPKEQSPCHATLQATPTSVPPLGNGDIDAPSHSHPLTNQVTNDLTSHCLNSDSAGIDHCCQIGCMTLYASANHGLNVLLCESGDAPISTTSLAHSRLSPPLLRPPITLFS